MGCVILWFPNYHKLAPSITKITFPLWEPYKTFACILSTLADAPLKSRSYAIRGRFGLPAALNYTIFCQM